MTHNSRKKIKEGVQLELGDFFNQQSIENDISPNQLQLWLTEQKENHIENPMEGKARSLASNGAI